MVKSIKDYHNLVKDLEIYAQENYDAYKRKVFLLAILGYAYILILLLALIILLLLALLLVLFKLSFITIKLFIVLAIPIFLILKSFWIKIDKPQGYEIKSKDHKELFQTIEELRKTLNTPKIHTILLDYQFNAGIVQYPRLGLLGFPKNYLMIGIPLMHAISKEQFIAIMAHELAHISRSHGKFSSQIYMLRNTWWRILQSLQAEQSWTYFLFSKFINWYSPFFSAYTFVLSRNHEYEADKIASEVVGAKHCAEALINSDLKCHYLEKKYWLELYQKANDIEKPPETVITDLLDFMKQPIPAEEAKQIIDIAYKQKSTIDHVHPSLTDRLMNIQYVPKIPSEVSITAAETFFESNLKHISRVMDSTWMNDYYHYWVNLHEYVKHEKEELKLLEEKALKNEIGLNEAWQFATKTEFVHGNDKAIPFYYVVLEDDPTHSGANYVLGKYKLSKLDPEGIVLMNNAIKKDYKYREYGYYELYSYYTKINDLKESEKYYNLYLEQIDLQDLARQERELPLNKGEYIPHNILLEDLEKFTQFLSEFELVSEVYLARKKFKYIPEWNLYVCCVKLKGNIREIITGNYNNSIEYINVMANNCPITDNLQGQLYYSLLNYKHEFNRGVEKKIKQVRNSLVYSSKNR